MKTLTFLPSLLCVFFLSNPTCVAQGDPNYRLHLSSASGFPGSTVDLRVFLDFPLGVAVHGFSFGVCASPGDSSLVVVPCAGGIPNGCFDAGIIAPGEAMAAANGGHGPTYFAPQTHTVPTHGWTVGSVVHLLGKDSLPPQKDAEIIVTRYQLVGPPGNTSKLTFCEIGDPLVLIAVGLHGGGDLIPETSSSGSLSIEEAVFLRGDADSDGTFAGLNDGLFILHSVFLPGAPQPICMESADVDGNGVFSALVDALYALNYQFFAGLPAPPAPFPECGQDPDPLGSIGCAAFPGCP